MQQLGGAGWGGGKKPVERKHTCKSVNVGKHGICLTVHCISKEPK